MRWIAPVVCIAAGWLLPSTVHAGEGWAQLHRGMTRRETAATLGSPLMSNHGRGFETWVYDHGAEVVHFRGRVVAWTGPDGADARGAKLLAVDPDAPKPVANVAKTQEPPPHVPLYHLYDKFPAFRAEIRM